MTPPMFKMTSSRLSAALVVALVPTIAVAAPGNGNLFLGGGLTILSQNLLDGKAQQTPSSGLVATERIYL